MTDYLPYLTSEDLQLLFGYRTLKCLQQAVRKGNFPVPTYKIGRFIVADKEVVREFFANQREQGLQGLEAIRRRQERNAQAEWDDVSDSASE